MAAAILILVCLCFLQAGDPRSDRWAGLYKEASQQLDRGDFEGARSTADRAYRHWSGSAPSSWHWPFRLILAESLIEQDRAEEALPLLEERAPLTALEARRLADMALVKLREKDLGAARDLVDAAGAANPREARGVAGKIDLIRGVLYQHAGQLGEAEMCFRRALDSARGVDPLIESYTLSDLGVNAMHAFRNDEAATWFERARDVAQRSGMKRGLIVADNNLGVCYRRLGDLDKALRSLGEVALAAEQQGDRVYLMRILVGSGEASLEQGEDAKAQAYLERATRMTSPGKDDDWRATALVDLAKIALSRNDLDAASELNREAKEAAERSALPRPVLAQKLQAADIAAARRDYVGAQQRYNDALLAAQQLKDPDGEWQSHAGLAFVFRKTARIPAAQSEYRLAIAAIEGQRSKLHEDEFKLTFLSNLIRFYGDYIDFLVDRGDKEEAFRVAQSCRARVLEEKQHQGDETSNTPDLAALNQAARASQSTVLSYWLAPRRSFLWALDGTKTEFFELPPEAEITAHVRKYGDAIDRSVNPLDTGDADARWLAEHILPAQYRALGGRNIVIEPDGALHQLNFESLPSADGKHYWLEDATVSIAPSLALLRVSAIAPKRKLLLFGDPDFTGGDLPRLPNLKTEIDAVARRFTDKTVYTASAATPAAYDGSHPEGYSTLHFATHALANRESPLDSAIVLAGPPETRKLYARDILRQPLNAELVTLSACQTAGSRTYYGEGSLGFSWAFLSAGARNVVAGLWQVDDRATAALMDRFYEAQAAGLSPAAALRQAKLKLMQSTPIYRKPRYWAAFETFTRALYR